MPRQILCRAFAQDCLSIDEESQSSPGTRNPRPWLRNHILSWRIRPKKAYHLSKSNHEKSACFSFFTRKWTAGEGIPLPSRADLTCCSQQAHHFLTPAVLNFSPSTLSSTTLSPSLFGEHRIKGAVTCRRKNGESQLGPLAWERG